MHDHSHHHSHSHATDFSQALLLGIALNIAFVAVEVFYGFRSNSLALLSDAGHNVSDVLGLVMAWAATKLAKTKPTSRHTYGLQSSSIMAALANGILLMTVTGALILEAIQRFQAPPAIAGSTVIYVAAAGIAVNGMTALLFMKGRAHDVNIRGAFLHMAADAGVSLGVVITALLLMNTGWLWLDPLVTLLIATVIIVSTWGLLKESLSLAMHGVPAHIDPAKVRQFLLDKPEVAQVHDLHIWAMSTTETALSVHLIMKAGHPGDIFTRALAHELDEHFHIGHSTIQIELGDDDPCALAAGHGH